MAQPLKRVFAQLRALMRESKWRRLAVLAVVLIVAYVIAVSLLPNSVLNTFHQVEEKSNGIIENPNGGRESR